MLNKETEYRLLLDGVPLDTELVQYELTTTDGRLCFWIVTDTVADYFYFDPDRVTVLEV
jgi:hypothetical protein